MTLLASIGFRVKSGVAPAIILTGGPQEPRVVERHVVALSDPDIPQSRQPYHAVLEAGSAEAQHLEKRLCKVVQTVAGRSVLELHQYVRNAGYQVRRVGLVVGSAIDPAQIKNEHIRAHALEGRLFRTALKDAARSIGWEAFVLVERSAYAEAASTLARPEAELKRVLAELGRGIKPWRADEKTAALAAWMALAQ
jgi:hypothetical protein